MCKDITLEELLRNEAKNREKFISKEAFLRHKLSLAHRWFEYYRKSKKDKTKLIDQYNKIATMIQR